jgi:VWFA-related protein
MNKIKSFGIPLLILVLAVCFSAAGAQDKPQRSKIPEYQQRIAVNYMLVDVVVTDDSGKYIRNLTKDDFELFENGERMEIISLDEFSMGAEQQSFTEDLATGEIVVEQPPRNIIIFVDLFFSSSYGITRAIGVTEEFILDRVQPGDKIMIVAYFNGLKVVQPFTDDKVQAIRALRQSGLVSGERTARLEAQGGTARPSDIGVGSEIDLNEELQQAQNTSVDDLLFSRSNAQNYLKSLKSLAEVVKQIKGRKTLIMLSGGIDFSLIDSTERNFTGSGPGGRIQGQPNYASGGALGVTSLVPQYRDTIEEINDSKVSVYTVNTSGLLGPGNAAEQFGSRDPVSQGFSFDAGTRAGRARQNFLSSLAKETGGRAYFNKNDLRSMLDDIEVDISNYYILGYRSSFNPDDSEYRDLDVNIKIPGANVLHRDGFNTPVPFEGMDEEERDIHLVDGFLSGMQINQLKASAIATMIPIGTDDMRISLAISVPVEELEKDGDTYRLQLLASNLSEKNNILNSSNKSFEIPESALKSGETSICLVETLKAVEGVNKVRVALRDNMNGERSYFYFNTMQQKPEEDTVVITRPLFHSPEASDPVVNRSNVDVDVMDKWNEGEKGADLMIHPELGSIFPTLRPVYANGDTVHFFARVKVMSSGKADPDKLRFLVAVSPVEDVAEDQRQIFKVTTDRLELIPYRSGVGMALVGELRIVGWEPGEYDLLTIVADPEKGSQATSNARIIVNE